MMRVIGYCRVSTKEQSLELQKDAIKQFAKSKGIEDVVIYEEKVSSRKKRPELEQALKAMTKDDIFCVYKIDRIARSIKELEQFVEDLKVKGVTFATADGRIDLSSPSEKFTFQLLGIFAEFERNILSERTKAGLEAARARGRVGGRPKLDDKKREQIRDLREKGSSITEIARIFELSRTTVYSVLEQ
ncbi:MAG: recombinase family protein [Enterococcus sp.]|nr:recombinase family protein [Enterococcus sp.]